MAALPTKLLIYTAIIYVIVMQIQSCYQWLTGTSPKPPTPQELAITKEQLVLLKAAQQAIDDNDIPKVAYYLSEGLTVNAKIPANWDDSRAPLRSLLDYAIHEWSVFDTAFMSRPGRRTRPVGYQNYHATQGYFRTREPRFKLIKFLESQGATVDLGLLDVRRALHKGYLPLLDVLQNHGWDKTAPMWENGPTPLVYLANNHPKVALTATVCRHPGEDLCKAIKREMVFWWILDAPNHDFQETDEWGRSLLMRGVLGAHSEAEAMYRIEFWNDKGLSACTQDNANRTPADYFIHRGWIRAHAMIQCSL